MNKKKFIFVLIAILLIVGAGAAALLLTTQQTQKPQETKSRASVSTGGLATISLSPVSGTYTKDDTFDVDVKLKPNDGIVLPLMIDVFQFELQYSYTGSAPDISVVDDNATDTGIQIKPLLTSFSTDLNSTTAEAGIVKIYYGAHLASGYALNAETAIARIKFRADKVNATGVALAFNSTKSKVFKQDNSMDVLGTPASAGNYKVVVGGGTTKYKCSGASCVEDATGGYTVSNCLNECTAAVTPMYKCVGTTCTRDDTNGTYTASDCGGACSAAPGTPVLQSLKVKLQAVNKKVPGQVFELRFKKGNVDKKFLANGVSNDSGVFTISNLTLVDLPADTGYTFTIKGPKHAAKKVCLAPNKVFPITQRRSCLGSQKIDIIAGNNVFDLTGTGYGEYYLSAGDLKGVGNVQDGFVNGADADIIRSLWGKTDDTSRDIADLNYDGKVTLGDLGIIAQTLAEAEEENE